MYLEILREPGTALQYMVEIKKIMEVEKGSDEKLQKEQYLILKKIIFRSFVAWLGGHYKSKC